MALPSPSYTITMRVQVPASQAATSELVAAVAAKGASVTGVDIAQSTTDHLTVDLTCDTIDGAHSQEVVDALEALEDVRVLKVSDSTFLMHLGGKIEVGLKVPLRTRRDLSRAYTPGVARVCMAIHERPEDARRLTIKRNTVAVVTDGTAVLGLGDIGAAAAMPVMEGKAALFKQFGDVDAWPVVLDTKDTEEIIRIVKAIAPAYGGVNALKVVGKRMADVRIVVSGVGAAGSAIIRLLLKQGARHIVGYDINGAVCRAKPAPDENWAWIAEHTNDEAVDNTLREGLAGA